MGTSKKVQIRSEFTPVPSSFYRSLSSDSPSIAKSEKSTSLGIGSSPQRELYLNPYVPPETVH